MPLATRTIQDSINWAKRYMFNRNPVIGNSLEPALTSANIVIQTILGPPFEWWWNNQDLVFTCNPTPKTATSTAVSIVSGTLTVTATNNFAIGDPIFASGFTGGATTANGNIFEVLTANGTGFTCATTLANTTDTVGTFTGLTTQDYTLNVPLFSHIEHASVLDLDSTGAPLKWYELTVKNNLSLESSQNRPQYIGPHIEDGNGNITFRMQSAPDKPYPVEIHVQLVPPQITSINQTWAPLPDFMQNVYNLGFLALMLQFSDDPSRGAYYENKFKAALLGRQEGLSEEQRNIFLNNWEELQAGAALRMQQGMQARAQ